MTQEEIVKILKVGVLLSYERDLNRLLEEILACLMDLAHCDAGTLYLLDGDALRFKIMRNDTMQTYSGGDGKDPDLPPVPLRRENVCALSLIEGRTVRIKDVYTSTECDFSGAARYDAMTGYHTQSMLVVPLRNRQGQNLGVIQLLNALDENGEICAFTEDNALMLESVGSQAAITIQNVRYIEEIKDLFQSFVRVMSSAVDERTPYNGSHTRHMVAYCERFLDYLNQQARARGSPEKFVDNERDALMLSVWLHDIGKLVTPLEVMNKDARLTPEQHTEFKHRMEIIRLRAEIDRLKGKCTEAERRLVNERTREAETLIEHCNSAGYLPPEKLAALDVLAGRTYEDGDRTFRPWLSPEEHQMMSIERGTLSPEERAIMQDHVIVTRKLLGEINFPGEYANVREWASMHHEFLDGSGYPDGLKGERIPAEVRILTILDIFDALTADDRPYKPGIPVEEALSILDRMANEEGKLDPELTRQFIESRCWELKGGGET